MSWKSCPTISCKVLVANVCIKLQLNSATNTQSEMTSKAEKSQHDKKGRKSIQLIQLRRLFCYFLFRKEKKPTQTVHFVSKCTWLVTMCVVCGVKIKWTIFDGFFFFTEKKIWKIPVKLVEWILMNCKIELKTCKKNYDEYLVVVRDCSKHTFLLSSKRFRLVAYPNRARRSIPLRDRPW